MDITSPYVVIAAIVIAFLGSILFAISSKEDGHDDEHNGHNDHSHA